MHPILCHSKDKHSNFPSNHKNKKKKNLQRSVCSINDLMNKRSYIGKKKIPNIIVHTNEQVRCKEVIGLGYKIRSVNYLM